MHSRLWQFSSKLFANREINPLFNQTSLCLATQLSPLLHTEILSSILTFIRTTHDELFLHLEVANDDFFKKVFTEIVALRQKCNQERRKVIVKLILLQSTIIKKTYADEFLTRLSSSSFFDFQYLYQPKIPLVHFHACILVADSAVAILRPARLLEKTNQSGLACFGGVNLALVHEFHTQWNKLAPTQLVREQNYLNFFHARIPCILLGKKVAPLSTLTRSYSSPFKMTFIEACAAAKRSINILTHQFAEVDVVHALANAANRQVSINLVLSNSTLPSILEINNRLSDGIKLLIMLTTTAMRKYLTIRWITTPCHSRFSCFDDELALIGTSDLNDASLYYNQEIDILFEHSIKSKEFTQHLFTPFFRDGVSHFLQIYLALQLVISEQVHRLKQTNKQNSSVLFKRLNKAAKIKNSLMDITGELNHPDILAADKPQLLLNKITPSLLLNREGRGHTTASYLNVFTVARKYGMTPSVLPTPTPVLELEMKNFSSR